MQKCVFLLLVAALAVAFIAGCRPANNDRLRVTVSIDPQRWLLEQIAGDRVAITVFMPGDANPENFDPTMATVRDAASSDLFLRMGHLPWEEKIIARVKTDNDSMTIVDTSEGIDLIRGTHNHEGHDDHGGHEHSDVDPHTWGSVKNARIIARNMLSGLLAIDPAGTEYYNDRYRRLDQKLDSLDRQFARQLAPLRGASFLVWHPSLSYFARDYGLNQIAIGRENTEISLPMMREKLKEVGEAGTVGVFFIQPQMDAGGRTNAAIDASGASKFVIHPLAADWQSEMENVVNALIANCR